LVCITTGTASRVQILNAQDHPAALPFGAEPCKKAAQDISQMNTPAGRGGKSSHCLHKRHLPQKIPVYFLLSVDYSSFPAFPQAGHKFHKTAPHAQSFYCFAQFVPFFARS
jgi:hypothetical protein